MKSIILYAVFAVGTFSAAAGGSWVYFNSSNELSIPATEQAEIEVVETLDTDVEPAPPDSLPSVAIEGNKMSAAEIFRFGATIKSRQETLNTREQQIAKRELRLNLIQTDIASQQREMEGMIEQNRNLVDQGETLISKLAQEQQKLKSQQTEVQEKLSEITRIEGSASERESVNIKQGADWMQNLEADKASETLVEWINEGKMNAVIETLRSIESRKVAGILAEMDKEIRMEVLNSLKESDPPAPKTARKR